MNRTNIIVAAGFLALGLFLVISGERLPSGIGRLPGAGFFPTVIGAVTLGLALVLLLEAFRQAGPSSFSIRNRKAIGAAIGLTLVYVLLWGSGLFVLRTAVFAALFLRVLGEPWKSSFAVAGVLSIAITLAFQVGLRVSLE